MVFPDIWYSLPKLEANPVEGKNEWDKIKNKK